MKFFDTGPKNGTSTTLLASLSLIIVLVGFYLVRILFFKRTWLLDEAHFISDKVETLEVVYVGSDCDCADWLDIKYANLDEKGKMERSFFIEAADPKRRFEAHSSWHHTRLRLAGRFYRDKGISRDWESPINAVPEHARVFRYDNYTIIKPSSPRKPSLNSH